jgi:protein-disulfide isomerase
MDLALTPRRARPNHKNAHEILVAVVRVNVVLLAEMSSRAAQKEAARQLRMAAEAQATRRTRQRLHRRRLIWTFVAAAAVVAVAVALSSSRSSRFASSPAGRLSGAAFSSRLFAGIPQHGNVLGHADAPVRLVEFADLQCPYCDEYAVQALPSLVASYVREGKVQMQFENLSFIGPDSVKAGRAAAAAADQNRLWNFVDLLYLNQGEENTGYVTASYLHRLMAAVPDLNVSVALQASRTPAADAALLQANRLAARDGVSGTPTFLVGRTGRPLRIFQPASLTAAPFEAEINRLLAGVR